MDGRVPHVRGALVTGPAAYALSRVLDRTQVEADLKLRGFKGGWCEVALAALEAIYQEANAWAPAAQEAVRRAEAAGSARGTTPVPNREKSSLSGVGVQKEEFTTAEAADVLGHSTGYVRRLARSHQLPGRQMRGRGDWQLDAAAVRARAQQKGAA